MSKAVAPKSKNNLRDRYLEGNLTVEQYVNQILNGREGDRNRQNIEQKHNKILKKARLISN